MEITHESHPRLEKWEKKLGHDESRSQTIPRIHSDGMQFEGKILLNQCIVSDTRYVGSKGNRDKEAVD
jgi:hypothetical protein